MNKKFDLVSITNIVCLVIFSLFVLCSLAAQAAPEAEASVETASTIDIETKETKQERNFQFFERQVVIGKEDALKGVLTVPVTVEGRVPCIVLVHGVGRNDRNNTVGPNKPFMELAHKLASKGIAVLRYDKRTFAHPACTLNPEFGIEQETVNDAVEALEVSRLQEEIDPDQVFVAGHSMGGLVVSKIVQRDAKVAGVIILCSPGKKLMDTVKSTTNDAVASFMVAKSWEEIKEIEAPAELSQIGKRVFIAQGTTDEIVSSRDGMDPWRKAVENDSNESLSLSMYPGMNHFLLQLPNDGVSFVCPGQVPDQLVSDLSGWLQGVVRDQGVELVSKL